MLLRSSSTPISNSNSWLPHHSKDCCSSSPEAPDFRGLQRTRSVSFHSSSSSSSSIDDHKQKLTQTNIQNDNTPKQRKNREKAVIPVPPHSLDKKEKQQLDEEKESKVNFRSIERIFSSSGLGEKTDSNVIQTLVMGGGAGNDGGKICGGAGGGGGLDGGDHIHSTDVYYQKMIEANPGNPLLLGNYAKFLKEVIRIYIKLFFLRLTYMD